VATDKGLVVPVIRDVKQLTLNEITRQRAEIVAKAKAGGLLPDDYANGTFTITNLGMFGIDAFAAILNPPQSAILAVGRIKERPFVANGQVVARPTLHLTLSADHRVLDGADAARLLSRIVELIEVPQRLIETMKPGDD
jgi:pyruvate dehydrogenase E2 component (dihydrolipoamide acetyltransferase)